MDSLVTLEIVIAIEALGTLIALEWPVGGRGRHAMVWWVSAIKVLCTGHVTAVEPRQKPWLHATHHRHRVIGAVNVRHDGTIHRRQGVRRPWLAGKCQRRLSAGAMCMHPTCGMNAQSRRIHRRATIDGRVAGLVRVGTVQRVSFGRGIRVVRGERSGRRGGSGRVESHTPWLHGGRDARGRDR